MYLLCPSLVNEYYNVSTEIIWSHVFYIKIDFYNQFWICISIRSTPCNWTVDDPTFALVHLFFAKNTYFSTYFWQLIVLILRKIILSIRNIFTNAQHVFLRILITNLRVLCFDIFAIPTMCTPYYQSRLNLVSEICLVNILTFSEWGITVIF